MGLRGKERFWRKRGRGRGMEKDDYEKAEMVAECYRLLEIRAELKENLSLHSDCGGGKK